MDLIRFLNLNKYVWIALLLGGLSFSLSAQWQAHFADSAQLSSPPWWGDLEKFDLSGQALVVRDRHARRSGNRATLIRSYPTASSYTWRGRFGLDVAPQPSDHVLWRLISYPPQGDLERYVELEWSDVDYLYISETEYLRTEDGTLKKQKSRGLIEAYQPYIAFLSGEEIDFHVTLSAEGLLTVWLRVSPSSLYRCVGQTDELDPGFREQNSMTASIECHYSSSRKDAVLRFPTWEVWTRAFLPSETPELPHPVHPEEHFSLLLNELMPNPLAESSEYIEVCNPTHEVQWTDDYEVEVLSLSGRRSVSALASSSVAIPPQGVLALSKKPESVLKLYPAYDSIALCSTLPVLPNAGFTIRLIRKTPREVVDELIYSPDLLGQELSRKRGVALERFDDHRGSNASDVWGAALASYQWATPGRQNSLCRDPKGSPSASKNLPRLIVNEFLTQPKKGCSEFVELFHADTIPILLREYGVEIFSPTSASQHKIVPLSEGHDARLLLPGEYWVLTRDRVRLGQCYSLPKGSVGELPSLPSLPDEVGVVQIVRLSDHAIGDRVAYSSAFFDPEVIHRRGVSCERRNPWVSASDSANWGSASEYAGWATPGRRNSLYQKGDSPLFLPSFSASISRFSLYEWLQMMQDFLLRPEVVSIRVAAYSLKGFLLWESFDSVFQKSLCDALCTGTPIEGVGVREKGWILSAEIEKSNHESHRISTLIVWN